MDTDDDLLINTNNDVPGVLFDNPFLSSKPIWWAKVLGSVLADLLFNQCIQNVEDWTTVYVYFLLAVSSEEWQQASLFGLERGAYIFMTLVCYLVTSETE